jgi:hypothetical protein
MLAQILVKSKDPSAVLTHFLALVNAMPAKTFDKPAREALVAAEAKQASFKKAA